jgi:hypothetical protein
VRPPYAHAQQRSFYRLDHALDEQAETIPPQPAPEPIPTGEAEDSDWRAFQEAMEEA